MELMKHTLCASILALAAHGAQAAVIPAVCPSGQTAVTVFFDGLEQGSGNFRLITPVGSNVWSTSSFGPNTGTQALRALPAVEQPTESYIGIAQPIPILTDGYYLQFAHSFNFELANSGGGDGGIIVYSTGGFDPFVDASHLIVFPSQSYNGFVCSDNPLAAAGCRSVFGDNSQGYKVTRLKLSQFVGLNFDFAFGFGSDSSVNSPGWLVDDVQVYRCGTELPPAPPDPNPTPPPTPPPPASPTCRGFSATLVGTDEEDTLTGTAGPDVIVGFAGNDVIDGRGGNDLICGGPGNDKLKGGAGKDKIYGEAGKDKIKGGSGFDDCNGGSGRDSAACEVVTKVP